MRHYRAMALTLALLALMGCSKSKDEFASQKKPQEASVAYDSAKAAADSARRAAKPDTSAFGFTVSLAGGAELHFYDEQDRHSGPAAAAEYLPIIESMLSNPGLHQQERLALEEQRATIQRTGSAAQYALFRQIPNLKYTMSEDAKQGSYVGAGEILIAVRSIDVEQLQMAIKAWNGRWIRSAVYRFNAGAGQAGQMNVSGAMDDFTLAWDANGDGQFEKEIMPLRLDSAAVK